MERVRDLEYVFIIVMFMVIVAVGPVTPQRMSYQFYSQSCPMAESIVRSVVWPCFAADGEVASDIWRMHFSDCFVRGCDASILIEGPHSEKIVLPNLRYKGYDVINEAKARLEAACPNTVSCADILTIAARDATYFAGGLTWTLALGRLDGRISRASEVNLPVMTDPISVQKQKFAVKGFNVLKYVL